MTKRAGKKLLRPGAWVWVEWDDACDGPGGWVDAETAARETNVAKCITVGYVVKRDRKQVSLAASRGLPDGDLGHLIAIPLAWITRVELISHGEHA